MSHYLSSLTTQTAYNKSPPKHPTAHLKHYEASPQQVQSLFISELFCFFVFFISLTRTPCLLPLLCRKEKKNNENRITGYQPSTAPPLHLHLTQHRRGLLIIISSPPLHPRLLCSSLVLEIEGREKSAFNNR